jgi:hypothetical protein
VVAVILTRLYFTQKVVLSDVFKFEILVTDFSVIYMSNLSFNLNKPLDSKKC